VPPPSETPDAVHRVISPDYFRTMGIPLLRGRYFTEADNENAPQVAIISERLARDYWPGGNPIGSQLSFPGIEKGAPGKQPTRFLIVGVVKGEKNRGLEVEPEEEVYLSYSQKPSFYDPRTLLVKTSGDPTRVASAIRHEVSMLDPEQPVSEVQTMDQVVAQARAGHRFPMVLLGLFAALALALASVGIYGVMSYSVAERAHEIGIRMALGAEQSHVLRAVLRRGLSLAALGVGIGLGGALAASRVMASLISGPRPEDPHLVYGVGASDPLTFVVVTLVLTGVGFLASYMPAVRAAGVDPMEALRHE
jgi:putative ABC transport system permease protein